MCEVPHGHPTQRFEITNSVLIFLDTTISSPSNEPAVTMAREDIRINSGSRQKQQMTFSIPIQLDVGAADIICSPELAERVDTWIFDHDVQLMGFNVRLMPKHELTSLIVETNSDLDRSSVSPGDKEEFYSCTVYALIHQSVPFELLLSADLIHKHNLVTYSRQRSTIFGVES
jgi:hypothetical protein